MPAMTNRMTAIAMTALLMMTTMACTTEPAKTMDPTGTWGAVLSWTQGDCHLTGVLTTSVVVAPAPGGGFQLEGTQGRTITGITLCTATQCELSFTETGPTGDANITQAQVEARLTADASGDIVGEGAAGFEYRDGTSCTQKFVASGHMDEGVVISP